MKRKWMLAVAVGLAVALAASVSAAAATLYVGDTKAYSVAFKAEGADLYVMELAGATHCYFTEPHEDLGKGGFSAFPAPTLMLQAPKSYVAEDVTSSLFGGADAQVRANVIGDAVTGTFSFDESEESYHCDTGSGNVKFEATSYQPSEVPAPTGSSRKPVYYGSEGSIEIFLRTTGKEAGGIRGAFVSQCPVEGDDATLAGHSLFERPAFAKRGKQDGFRHRDVVEGGLRGGGSFREKISLVGRIQRDAVTGSYTRIRTRTTRFDRQPVERCVTGPIPYRAARYLPASG